MSTFSETMIFAKDERIEEEKSPAGRDSDTVVWSLVLQVNQYLLFFNLHLEDRLGLGCWAVEDFAGFHVKF